MIIINQIEIDDYTVIEVSDQTYFGDYAVIDGKEYLTEIVYDLEIVSQLKQKVILLEKKCLFMIKVLSSFRIEKCNNLQKFIPKP